MKHIVIVGGGAAGLISAIYSKTNNNIVTILERNSSCGKKILATGNGKCNYWNDDQNINHYHSTNNELLPRIITKELIEEVPAFFNNLGIVPKIKNGYYYPFSNQATTIKNALLNEIENKKIKIRHDVLVNKITKKDNYFEIETENEIIKADKVIIATGSCASPKTGSDGIGYKLLKRFNHNIIEPYPALVQLKTKGSYLKEWAGVRTDVKVSLYEDNNLIKEESGEIQLTDYGISGICIFNLSRYIPLGLNKGKKEEIVINFLPFIENNNVKDLFKNNNSLKHQLEAILNNKLVNVILRKTNINEKLSFNELNQNEQELLIENLINFKVEVIGYNSFDNSQTASGGLSLTEINPDTMESTLVKGLYIVGELLDVDGDCGGYNLGFAWMSGMKAGKDISTND
ncbi:MAG: NAD(P)/FAD-dependent oxidoreductase [Bacilli bacterium]|nr:NAD(P)/FAD-dependent oxidoreductase [Bacilli bacterium]